jgi:outer membrane receptor protein involved in Fe transport
MAMASGVSLHAQSETPVDTVVRKVDLEEVMISAPSLSRTVAQQAIRATVVDIKDARAQPATLTDVMNRSAGVRIRQTGGLGAETSVMLNGFGGKSIRYFKDGVPTDYLGAAFNFSIVPVNMIERVEVYKGVLPVSLGADALGGAVNIVSRQAGGRRTVDVAYQYGSFNTHRASVNVRTQTRDGRFFGGMDAFFNHSDNDYRASVPVVDTETAVAHVGKRRLFHNRFTNGYAEIYAGVANRPWADNLRIGLTAFHIARQHNYGSSMEQPFGAATGGMYSVIPTLKYVKSMFDNRLKAEQFFAVNTLHTHTTDTARGRYDWNGVFTPVASRAGEISTEGSLLKLRYSNFTSRSHISLNIHPAHTLELNVVYTGVKRTGEDPRGIKFQQTDIDDLNRPATLSKIVAAAGLKSFFSGEKLSNNLFVKYFSSRAKGLEMSAITTYEQEYELRANRIGAGEALKYSFGRHLFARLSGESAVRLPEQEEFFGNGDFILSNFALLPERSYNFNLGIHAEKPELFAAECNLFYRRTYDMILLINTGLLAQYKNVDKVKGVGLELDARYSACRWLNLSANMTFQDFRLFGQSDPTYEGARLRNTPFFFANTGINTDFGNLFKRSDRLSAYWYYHFVREYYLNYIPRSHEPGGWLGLWGKPKVNVASQIIPDQQMHTVGCLWQSPGRMLALSLEIKNIFDAEVFDNYRIQNAGRSFHVKINVHL